MSLEMSTAPSARVMFQVRGRLGRPPVARWWRALSLLTGLALLRWVGRFVLTGLLGHRSRGELTLTDDQVFHLETSTSLMGKTIGQRRESFRGSAVAAFALETRHRYLYLLVGVASLVGGILLGVVAVADGLRGGYPVLTVGGLLLILLGVALDLGAYLLSRRRPGRTAVVFHVLPKRVIRLEGVGDREAEDLARLMDHHLGKRGARAPLESRELREPPVPAAQP